LANHFDNGTVSASMSKSSTKLSTKLSHSPWAIAALLTNAMVWGLSWIPFRYLADRGVHSLWATSMMYGIVVVGLILMMVFRESSKSAHEKGVSSKSRPWFALMALMISAGITNCAFNWAVTIGDVVRTVLLFYLMPIWTLLLARWFLKEPLNVGSWLRIVLCLAGAVLVLTPAGETFGIPIPKSLADILGLVGGMGFAATNVALRACSNKKALPADVTFAMFSGGALLPGALALALTFNGTINFPPAPQPAWLGAIAVLALAFLFGNLALQYGASRLPASIIAAIMPSEVVFAAVSAAWLAGEALTPQLLIGGCLILSAALLSMFDKQTH
jgi:drug/metabolite transporter (DMT)-like permease